MTITKRIIAKEISKQLGLTNSNSLNFINKFVSIIKQNTKTCKVKINKFGTFELKETPERIGRNPMTKERYKIKSFKKLRYKAAFEIKKNIN